LRIGAAAALAAGRTSATNANEKILRMRAAAFTVRNDGRSVRRLVAALHVRFR
jgi:hypothetical protein